MLKRQKSHGTTLIEALITTVVFTFVSFAVFAVFNLGQTNWKLMTLRHGMQADGRKSFSMLEADLRRTHFSSVSVVDGTATSGTYQRDAICMAGLDDWRAKANYNPASSRPIWNRYILYYASKEETRQGGTGEALGTSGRFFRIIITPPLAQIGQYPYAGLPVLVDNLDLQKISTDLDLWLQNNAAAYSISSYQSLADVNHFSINKDDTSKIVQVTFQTRKKATLSERGDRGSAIGGAYETLQLNLNLAPQNSYYLY